MAAIQEEYERLKKAQSQGKVVSLLIDFSGNTSINYGQAQEGNSAKGGVGSQHPLNQKSNFVVSEYLSESKLGESNAELKNKRLNDSGQTERGRPLYGGDSSTLSTIETGILMS